MSKSERILLSHITVRGPDVESIYQVVKDQNLVSFDSLAGLFAIPEGEQSGPQVHQLRECLSFLEVVGILKRDKTMKKSEEFTISSSLPNIAFRLILLNRLKSSADNSFYLVHKNLVSRDILLIDTGALRRMVERVLSSDFVWTEEKLDFWMELAQYLGLGKKYVHSRRFTCFPTSELLWSLFAQYKEKHDDHFSLRKFINYISEGFFECFTSEGQLFRGLQQSLLVLQRKKRIFLNPAASDDPSPTFIDGKPVGLVSIKEDEVCNTENVGQRMM